MTRSLSIGAIPIHLRPIRSILIASASALALAACAGRTPPPSIAYDSAEFQAAVIETEPPRPVEVVTIAKPLPLPGQLLPPPSARRRADKRPPTVQVDAANKAALQEPNTHGYINAIQVYPFTQGALYRLYAAPERVSDIALQPGETLTAVAAGDTVRWVVGDTTSGSGETRRVHVLVKPFAPGLTTNLVIATDRRAYHLQLDSTDNTAMAAISWTYPQDLLLALQRRNENADAAKPVASGVILENLRFRYAISGDTPPWRPVRAFDDGSKVFIEFPARIDQGEAPPLFVVGPEGDNQLVNYRVRRNYYIVDRLFAAAELRLGIDPQRVVRISRTDTVSGGVASNAGPRPRLDP
jgi:type IV secretion system protein VirB9